MSAPRKAETRSWTVAWLASTSRITSGSWRGKPTRRAGSCCCACWRTKRPKSPSRGRRSQNGGRTSARSGAGRAGGHGPFTPMRRPHIQPLFGVGIHPAVENTPARKYQSMRSVIVDDGQLNVAGEWCAAYGLPHCPIFADYAHNRFDVNHIKPEKCGSNLGTTTRLRVALQGTALI